MPLPTRPFDESPRANLGRLARVRVAGPGSVIPPDSLTPGAEVDPAALEWWTYEAWALDLSGERMQAAALNVDRQLTDDGALDVATVRLTLAADPAAADLRPWLDSLTHEPLWVEVTMYTGTVRAFWPLALSYTYQTGRDFGSPTAYELQFSPTAPPDDDQTPAPGLDVVVVEWETAIDYVAVVRT